MRTNLPASISTVEEAEAFLTDLYNNGESYHPEDDAFDIVWNGEIFDFPNREESMQLNELMHQIYALPGNDGRHIEPLVFDPCEFLNKLATADHIDEILEEQGSVADIEVHANTPSVRVCFDDGTDWQGSFDELQNILQKHLKNQPQA